MSGWAEPLDVVVVGAGIGGLYAVKRMRDDGLKVLGFEAAPDVGGVWYHNRYPGARVDIESQDYCYWFSSELYNEWEWSERYATQPEILRYVNHVADRFDLRRSFRFNARVTSAVREGPLWKITADDGTAVTARFLVMASGQLSEPRKPPFKGLDSFKGRWVSTSYWPEEPVELAGKRIAVIGTGSSGIQTIPVLAEQAEHLYVFQRTPNYSLPAWNGPRNEELHAKFAANVPGERAALLANRMGAHFDNETRVFADFTPEERRAAVERKYAQGGQGMLGCFADQGTNIEANNYVSEFLREMIRAKVKDPAVAERLCPNDHPIGARRLCVDTGYYETFNRDNVTLVAGVDENIVEITETGIRTDKGHYEVDLIVFALGFVAFKGALDRTGIRNAAGQAPTDRWDRGPLTWMGLMTAGFPNLFVMTGPGGPSVLVNFFPSNEFHADYIADLIAWMDEHGYAECDPTVESEAAWTAHVAEAAKPFLRAHVKNYMLHENADGTSVFIPYLGGLGRYVEECREAAAQGYPGLVFTAAGAASPAALEPTGQ